MFCNLIDLVSHKNWVRGDQTLGEVFQLFSAHGFDFMAVLEQGTVVGICSKRDVGMLLGSKYGFSLFALKPIRDHLAPKPLLIRSGTPINEVFSIVFSRGEHAFFDDVALVGANGEFLGMIFTMTLVQLQNRFHLENIRMLEQQSKEIRLKNEQIEADLRLSRELQQALLPVRYPKFPARSATGEEALRFHHYYRPLGLVGGDFFLIKQVSKMAAGVFIADVMGHGVRSAIITAMLRAMLESLDNQKFGDPADLLRLINLELAEILLQFGNGAIFATALYLLVDAESQTLRYATAGHPLPLHVKARIREVETLDHSNPGTVLGVFEGAEFFSIQKPYEAGDAIIAFTDGITEVENPAGHEFGLGRLCEAVASNIGRTTQEIVDDLIARAGEFAEGEFTDDVCLVGIDLA